MENETMTFNYTDEQDGFKISMRLEETGLGLDTIFEKFERFLRAAGYDYVRIDSVGEPYTNNQYWTINKSKS